MRRSAPPTPSANAVSSHFIEGRFNEVRPERAKTQPPALTSEGDRDRLLPGLLAVARSNIASYGRLCSIRLQIGPASSPAVGSCAAGPIGVAAGGGRHRRRCRAPTLWSRRGPVGRWQPYV